MTLTVRDLCERFGVSEHTVLSWVHSGQIAAMNVGRHPGSKKPRWRFLAAAVAAFELARTATQPPPRTRRKKRRADVIEFY